MSTKTSPRVANVLFDNWVISYDIPINIFTENKLNVFSISFTMVSTLFGVTILIMMAYNLQANGQDERDKKQL